MIGFFFCLSLLCACLFGCWLGWYARTYLDRRFRHYFRRGQQRKAEQSGLSLDPEPLVDVGSIIDPVTRRGVRRLIEERNKNHVDTS